MRSSRSGSALRGQKQLVSTWQRAKPSAGLAHGSAAVAVAVAAAADRRREHYVAIEEHALALVELVLDLRVGLDRVEGISEHGDQQVDHADGADEGVGPHDRRGDPRVVRHFYDAKGGPQRRPEGPSVSKGVPRLVFPVQPRRLQPRSHHHESQRDNGEQDCAPEQGRRGPARDGPGCTHAGVPAPCARAGAHEFVRRGRQPRAQRRAAGLVRRGAWACTHS